jgi:hypothetical protein
MKLIPSVGEIVRVAVIMIVLNYAGKAVPQLGALLGK